MILLYSIPVYFGIWEYRFNFYLFSSRLSVTLAGFFGFFYSSIYIFYYY